MFLSTCDRKFEPANYRFPLHFIRSFRPNPALLTYFADKDQKRKDVLESVTKVTDSMVDGVNRGVARVFANQRKIEQVCISKNSISIVRQHV